MVNAAVLKTKLSRTNKKSFEAAVQAALEVAFVIAGCTLRAQWN